MAEPIDNDLADLFGADDDEEEEQVSGFSGPSLHQLRAVHLPFCQSKLPDKLSAACLHAGSSAAQTEPVSAADSSAGSWLSLAARQAQRCVSARRFLSSPVQSEPGQRHSQSQRHSHRRRRRHSLKHSAGKTTLRTMRQRRGRQPKMPCSSTTLAPRYAPGAVCAKVMMCVLHYSHACWLVQPGPPQGPDA